MAEVDHRRANRLVPLLSMLSIAAIIFAAGIPVHLHYRQQMDAITAIERIGGIVGVHGVFPEWLMSFFPAGTIRNHFVVVDEVSFEFRSGVQPTKSNLSGQAIDDGDYSITNDDLVQIGKFAHLKRLTLFHAPISDVGLKHLECLKELEFLCLSGTDVSDAGMETVARFENISTLQITGTYVSDVGLAQLAGLNQLAELDVGVTDVTEKSLAPFRAVPGLKIKASKSRVSPGFDLPEFDLREFYRINR